MPAERLKNYLDEKQIRYVVIRHSTAYTAQETAASAHVRGQAFAKTVMVDLDGKMAMVVLPATERVNLERLREATGASFVELVPEREFRARFPDCEVGAMPPFGNLYDLDTYVTESLGESEEISFNAGTHRELIQLRYEDFVRLVRPQVLRMPAVR
jgi:Ala-tRNA(Pro) deacylase